ncbi:hypothetical protein [Arenibaculum pallidiluteum]|uniref:hypothetical protein n=1 Tax=Arenibaculum pallidiluteum TaxID=2812559 RepID=UPI001A95DF41|nr:hypothetical protein [Arenibaculum pallidiluteum]
MSDTSSRAVLNTAIDMLDEAAALLHAAAAHGLLTAEDRALVSDRLRRVEATLADDTAQGRAA